MASQLRDEFSCRRGELDVDDVAVMGGRGEVNNQRIEQRD